MTKREDVRKAHRNDIVERWQPVTLHPCYHHLRALVDLCADMCNVLGASVPAFNERSYGFRGLAMMRMLIVGYAMGIRSERRLCEEVHLNLAYRWFCRLGLNGKVPDHSSFSKNRHGRFRQSDILRHMFETVVERCLAQGLVGAEGFAVDASLIAAVADKQRSVQEYLAVLNDAAFGAASPVTPKFISPSDPAAQWTDTHEGRTFFAYATNYLIDTDHGVIVDVEATRAIRQAEVGASRTMLERTEKRFSNRLSGALVRH